jgi:SNW domain-containing protein 1
MMNLYYKSLNNKNASKVEDLDLSKPDTETLIKTINQTKTALDNTIKGKIKTTSMLNNIIVNKCSKGEVKYIRYTPSQQGLTDKADATQRIVRLTELPKDPLEPVKFKQKRIPRDSADVAVPVMHSPPRKLTAEDQQNWKIPPCISNWKNARGFTIPLEMRLSADGRNLRDFSVNDKFSKFSDVMYMTEKQARKEIEERNKMQEAVKMVDTLKKEQELKEAAKEARMKKISLVSNISSVNTTKTDDTDIMLGNKRNSKLDEDLEAQIIERNNLRNLRKKEIERDRRIEVSSKKGKNNLKANERDISEKIALGQAQPTMRDSLVDARLYNQSIGVDAGFKEEEDYDLYDKPLFVDRTSASIYKNIKTSSGIDDESNIDKVDSKKLMEKIYKRGNMFEGADISKSEGGKPVEFEKSRDDYGLNEIHKKNNK